MNIKTIVNVTNGKLIKGNDEDICEKFSKDTRIIENGDTYIGIKGENYDGNLLWNEALEKGANAVIVEGIDFENEDLEKWNNKNIILVESTMDAINQIAKYKRQENEGNLEVIGVTGSVGKTSTKDIIASVVSQKYKTLKTEGNNNNSIGLPFTLFRLKDEEVAVIEMGMNHFGEMEKLSEIAQPTLSIITNIGTSHIGNLGSRENILKAKLEILEGMKKKKLIINNDNDLLHEFYENNKKGDIEFFTYGVNNASDIMAEDLKLNEYDSEFFCNINGSRVKVHVPIGGYHFVYNALCAITVGKLLKLSTDEILEGIEKVELTKKRMDILEFKNGVKIINDSYNASYESMTAALEFLKGINAKRKIAVLGDMFELGEFSKELHEKVGEEAVNAEVDILVCIGENAKYIGAVAQKCNMSADKIYYIENNKEAVEFLQEKCEEGDVVLVKASNGMRFFEIVDNLSKRYR